MWKRFRAAAAEVNRHKRVLALIYLVNLAMAGLLAYSFLDQFDQALGQSFYEEKMLRGLDWDWLMQMQSQATGLLATFQPTVLHYGPFVRNLSDLLEGKLFQYPWLLVSMGLVYLLVSTFLAGGVIALLGREERKDYSIQEYFRLCATYFGRFFRLMLIAAFLYWLLYKGIHTPLERLGTRISEAATTERPQAYFAVARNVLFLLILFFVNMVFDYAKIRTVVDRRRSMLVAAIHAVAFSLKNFTLAFGFYLFLASMGLASIAAYSLLEYWIPQTWWLPLLVVFVLQQAYLLAKLWLRLNFYSGQLLLYREVAGPGRPPEMPPVAFEPETAPVSSVSNASVTRGTRTLNHENSEPRA